MPSTHFVAVGVSLSTQDGFALVIPLSRYSLNSLSLSIILLKCLMYVVEMLQAAAIDVLCLELLRSSQPHPLILQPGLILVDLLIFQLWRVMSDLSSVAEPGWIFDVSSQGCVPYISPLWYLHTWYTYVTSSKYRYYFHAGWNSLVIKKFNIRNLEDINIPVPFDQDDFC